MAGANPPNPTPIFCTGSLRVHLLRNQTVLRSTHPELIAERPMTSGLVACDDALGAARWPQRKRTRSPSIVGAAEAP